MMDWSCAGRISPWYRHGSRIGSGQINEKQMGPPFLYTLLYYYFIFFLSYIIVACIFFGYLTKLLFFLRPPEALSIGQVWQINVECRCRCRLETFRFEFSSEFSIFVILLFLVQMITMIWIQLIIWLQWREKNRHTINRRKWKTPNNVY